MKAWMANEPSASAVSFIFAKFAASLFTAGVFFGPASSVACTAIQDSGVAAGFTVATKSRSPQCLATAGSPAAHGAWSALLLTFDAAARTPVRLHLVFARL